MKHPSGFDLNRLERLTTHLQGRYIDEGKISGCQLALMRHGHLAYQRSLGQMDLQRGRSMADDAIFRIYSMTKPVTSVALMMLYERGLFQLDDPVSRWVPSWQEQCVYVAGDGDGDGDTTFQTEPLHRPVSIRDLLRHTSGLTYGGQLMSVGVEHPVDYRYRSLRATSVDRHNGMMAFMDKLSQIPLAYQPGEQWMYSLATDACGALVEIISGQAFPEFLQDHIFDPLNMVDTGFQVRPHQRSRFVANYRRDSNRQLEVIDDPEISRYLTEPVFFSGGGGLVGTTADYLRFCEMLRRRGELDGARILGPRTLDMMTRNHLKDGKDLSAWALGLFSESPNRGVGFGLGFASVIDPVIAGVMGGGDYYWGGAASTLFLVDPREQISLVFMTQLMPSSTYNFRAQLKSIIYSAIID
jgi:CubicO group peptidase (beta-lactamase class C family)